MSQPRIYSYVSSMDETLPELQPRDKIIFKEGTLGVHVSSGIRICAYKKYCSIPK
jgi:hypothetical protein